jgi:hypothetical protein
MWAVVPLLAAAFALDSTTIAVQIDSAHHEVVITLGPVRLAPPEAHGGESHHEMHHGGPAGPHAPVLYPFHWPVSGWCRGFSIALADSAGRPLPRTLLHHLNVVNFERRQLVHPAYERLLAAGRETEDVRLPSGIAVPLDEGDRLGLLVMFGASEAGAPRLVYATLRLPWTPARRSPRPLAVVPLLMDVGFRAAKTDAFDIPPGRSERSFEFTLPVSGRLLGLGGHLHDYGVALRLEEAATGRVVAELRPRTDGRRVTAMPRKLYGVSGDGLRLRAGRRYRAVAVYESDRAETIPDGAMGVLGGIFAPDGGELPKSVAGDAALAEDAAGLDALRKEPPHSDPASVPPAPVGIVGAQDALLHAVGRAVDESAAADVHADVGDRSAAAGEREDVARLEGVELPLDRAAALRLVGAAAREENAVLRVGVLDEPGAVEAVAPLPFAAELIRLPHHLGRGRDDGVGEGERRGSRGGIPGAGRPAARRRVAGAEPADRVRRREWRRG